MVSFSRTSTAAALAVLSTLCIFAEAGKVQLDAMKHDIQGITAKNFDSVIGKFRDSTVSALWFYKHTDEDVKFMEDYNLIAKDMKGMVKITAINCNDWGDFCTKNNVDKTPSVMVYPINPIPASLYAGKMEKKALSSHLARMIPSNAVTLTKENIDSWLTTDITKPKVMLFSNKKTVPTIFKALSSETVFKRTAKFGFITESEADLVTRFKVKKFPQVMLQAGEKAQVKETYKGDMKYEEIRAWVNLFSESGMGDKVHSGGGGAEESIEDAKPWLVQEVPEVTRASHQDICFKGDGLCVIYLKEGQITSAETDMLTGLSKRFTSQLSDRGTKMKWMWMDMKAEAGFKKLFDMEKLPNAVVFNPHKRLRFTKLDADSEQQADNKDGIAALLDKVLGGDARFKMVPGQKLPAFADRGGAKKTDEKKKEL